MTETPPHPTQLFPGGRVVSGHTTLLDAVETAAQARGALKTSRLAVSGAFHTRLMQPARAALEDALKQVEFHAPRIMVYSNVTGGLMGADVSVIPGLLARQLVEPVQWCV